jgi:hypothetical protein
MRSPALAFVLLVAASLAAQRTYIVDPFNGPGTDFLDFPEAVAAAMDGDTIICRKTLGHPWGYRTFQTDKALTLLGEPGARFAVFNPAGIVLSVPAGMAFIIKGFEYEAAQYITCLTTKAPGGGRLYCENVHLKAHDSFGAVLGNPGADAPAEREAALHRGACRLACRP